jgi:hypothetical protein
MFCAKHQHAFIKVCSECVVEEYKQGVQSLNGDMFRYSSYWGTWSRVLRRSSGGGDETVEVDLTAVNPHSDLQWPRVLSCNIRAHRTALASNDIVCRSLPKHAVDLMHSRMDLETFDKLMHHDLLPLIDWEKYHKACNGGAALNNILKE